MDVWAVPGKGTYMSCTFCDSTVLLTEETHFLGTKPLPEGWGVYRSPGGPSICFCPSEECVEKKKVLRPEGGTSESY